MAKFIKLETEGKEYLVGFSNRISVLKAKRNGLEEELRKIDKAEGVDTDDIVTKMLFCGMLEKQPEITLKEVKEIYDAYITENVNDYECIDISAIIKFITEQYQAFSGLPAGKRKVKKLEIVDM